MLNLKKIAITGNIASGKSTASDFFKQKNAYIVNADEIGHLLLNPQTQPGQQILNLLGKTVITNGKFDRKKIASIVFDNKKKLQALEKILHPLIILKIEEEYERVKNKDYFYFVVDIPLLYEMGHESFYDYVIFIQTQKELGKIRFENKGFTSQEYQKRDKNLMPIESKKKKASFIVENNTSIDAFYEQIEQIVQKINQN